MRAAIGACVLGWVLLVGSAASAAPVAKAQAHAVVDAIMRHVEAVYVFPEKRAGIVAALRAADAAGRYDRQSPQALADTLTRDMRAVSHDKHMYINWKPAQYQALKTSSQSEKSDAYYAAMAARENEGFTAMRVLGGNVRYVRWASVDWSGKPTIRVMADVARFLAGGDAIILDLRRNGGGDSDAVAQFVSYFMPAKRRLLMTFHDGLSGKAGYSRVVRNLPGPRLTGRPLYVLIDGHTGSAAEEFAYHVKQFRLGTLVGQHTAGAANNDTLYPVAPGFVLSVSTGYPEHPVSHSNWEGVGVQPDVPVAAAAACDKALVLALEDRMARGPAAHRADDEAALAAVKARLAATGAR